MPFEMQYFYMQCSKFLSVLSVVDHISHLERVHKSFIVLLSSFKCTAIKSLEYKGSLTFYQRPVGPTQIVMWLFLTGCHLEINKGFMLYAQVYVCHRKTCYNFCLLTHTNSNQNYIIPYRLAISVNLLSVQQKNIQLASSLYKSLLMKYAKWDLC